MAALREIFASFGIQVDDKQLVKADKKMGDFVGTIKKTGQAIAGFFVVRGVKRMVEASIDAGDHLDKMSRKVGINTDALQEWEYAAKLSGVGAEKLGMSIGMLAKNADAAAHGQKEFSKTFKLLGVNVKDSHGKLKDVDTLMMDVADGIAGMDNDTQRAAIAMKLFGETGKDLIPLFEKGSAGVEEMRAELRKMGGVMSKEVIQQSVEAADNITRFEASLGGLRNILMQKVLPVVNAIVTKLTEFVKWAASSKQAIALLKTAAVLLGSVLAARVLPKIAGLAMGFSKAASSGKLLNNFFASGAVKSAAFAGGTAVAFLAVEDFIGMLQGKTSVIGTVSEAIDKWIEKMEKGSVVARAFRKTFGAVGAALGDAMADTILGTGALNEEARFQAEHGALSKIGANYKPEMANDDQPSFLKKDGFEKVARKTTVVATRSSGIQLVSNPSITINAGNADAEQVAKMTRREIEASRRDELKRARAAMPGGR